MNRFLFLLLATFVFTNAYTQNIGIGTGAPIGRPEVMGAGSGSGTNTLVLRNSTGDTLLRVRDDGRIGIGYNPSSGTYGRTVTIGGSGINFYTSNENAFGGSIYPTDTSLVLWSNSGANNYLVLQPSWGNTGIGTSSPNAKLHLAGAMLIGNINARTAAGYQLSVVGKIIAEEVRVLVSTSWPDYVFDDNYKLMPLEDLEKNIRQHRHLPNIPKASVIEKEGVGLGDMTMRLMEKVEELTLYIIELNKKNNALEEKLNTLNTAGLR